MKLIQRKENKKQTNEKNCSYLTWSIWFSNWLIRASFSNSSIWISWGFNPRSDISSVWVGSCSSNGTPEGRIGEDDKEDVEEVGGV